MRVERWRTRCSGFFCVAGVPMVLLRICFIMNVMCILMICVGISLSSHEDHLGRGLIYGWNSLTLGLVAAQWLVMSMFMMTRTIVLMLDFLATCEGHFGANRELVEAPWSFISLPSPQNKQLLEHNCGLDLALLSLALACGCGPCRACC